MPTQWQIPQRWWAEGCPPYKRPRRYDHPPSPPLDRPDSGRDRPRPDQQILLPHKFPPRRATQRAAVFRLDIDLQHGRRVQLSGRRGRLATLFFVVLAIGVSAWCWRWLNREHDARVQLALALIIGGALGNVIDRLWLGKVIDFILIYWAPWNWYYPAFNVADSAISIGAVLMLWSALFGSKRA